MRIRGRHSKTIAFQRAVLKKGKARIDARNKMFRQLEDALGRGDEEVLSSRRSRVLVFCMYEQGLVLIQLTRFCFCFTPFQLLALTLTGAPGVNPQGKGDLPNQ